MSAMTDTAAASSGICHSIGCMKTAKLRCPNCIKLCIDEGSHFCSQACFKSSWSEHKLIHNAAPVLLQGGSYDPFIGYAYTGKLRPAYPLSATRTVPSHIPRPDYAEDGIPHSEREARSAQIQALNPEETAIMRNVCKLAREVLDAGARAIAVGVTTDDIDRVVHEASIARDAYPSPLNYHRFPKSCCTSPNEVICHGIPDRRPLANGDILNIDVTIYKDGFHADLNETYLVGDVDAKGKKLVQTARDCLDKAITMGVPLDGPVHDDMSCLVKPGVLYRDLGKVIEKHADSQGFTVVRAYCGHGIGRLFHGAPNVPHYARNKAVGVMKPGHTFTIEPMISEGRYDDYTWDDNWTAVTADGKRSAQFEHTLLVTETGCEILTARLADSP